MLRHQNTIPGLHQLPAMRVILAVAAIGGAACAVMALMQRVRAAAVSVAVLMTVLQAGATWFVLPKVDPFLSARAAVRAAGKEIGDHQVYDVDSIRWRYGLEYYSQRELPPWTPTVPLPCLAWTNEETAKSLLPNPHWSVVMRTEGPWLIRLQ
jgi:hypothetical protein